MMYCSIIKELHQATESVQVWTKKIWFALYKIWKLLLFAIVHEIIRIQFQILSQCLQFAIERSFSSIDAEEKKSLKQNMSNGAIFLCVLTISFIIVRKPVERKKDVWFPIETSDSTTLIYLALYQVKMNCFTARCRKIDAFVCPDGTEHYEQGKRHLCVKRMFGKGRKEKRALAKNNMLFTQWFRHPVGVSESLDEWNKSVKCLAHKFRRVIIPYIATYGISYDELLQHTDPFCLDNIVASGCIARDDSSVCSPSSQLIKELRRLATAITLAFLSSICYKKTTRFPFECGRIYQRMN